MMNGFGDKKYPSKYGLTYHRKKGYEKNVTRVDDILTRGLQLITSKLRHIKPASPTVQTLAVLQAQFRSMKSFMNSQDNHHSHSPISQWAYVVLTTASINTDPLSRATTGRWSQLQDPSPTQSNLILSVLSYPDYSPPFPPSVLTFSSLPLPPLSHCLSPPRTPRSDTSSLTRTK